MAITLIETAHRKGARLRKCCEALGIQLRTLQRWKAQGAETDDMRHKSGNRKRPPNALSEDEYKKILTVVNSEKYRNLSPNQIVPLLADEGTFLCSEATLYRILRAERQLAHRDISEPKMPRPRPTLMADGPNQLWSWDISFLPTTVIGMFFKLYLVMDVWSRRIVAFDVHEKECSALGTQLLVRACRENKIPRNQITCHQDNGAPMRALTFQAKMGEMGVATSYSRPSVSNDNPFSEALFRTAKYARLHPIYRFETLQQARTWIAQFVEWYNNEHRHSGIKYVTPNQRHNGEDVEILARRQRLYESAKTNNPRRWTGKTRDWVAPARVHINPLEDAA
jgi:putative transposase